MREYSIGERCRGRWREILPALGVDSKFLINRHGPCPICGGKDRFRFDDKDGRGTYYCSQCPQRSGDGVSLLQILHGWEFLQTVAEIEKIIGKVGTEGSSKNDKPSVPTEAETKAEKFRQATVYWKSGAFIVTGDPVDQYLRRRLGPYPVLRAVRTIPATPFGGRTIPAMVSAFVDIHGDLAGIQRTFLTADGRKAEGLDADRWNTGSLPEGGAVRLFRPTSKTLGIAEGVETALSAWQLYNVETWAALNAGRLELWQPPEGVSEIVVFGDNDASATGQAAAYALAKRLTTAGLLTQVMIPPDIDTDWNDVWRAKLANGEKATA